MKKYAFLLLLFIFSAALAQETNTSPLSYQISLVKILQSKKGFVVRSKLTNSSSQTIVIDKNLIGVRVSFYTTHGYFFSSHEVGSKYEGGYVSLLPNQDFEQSQTINLENDFFRINGKYKLKLSYEQFLHANHENSSVWLGQVESNELSFQVRNHYISRVW